MPKKILKMKFVFLLSMLMSLFGCRDANGEKPEGPFKYYEYRSTTMREYPHEYYRLEDSEEDGLTLSWARCNSPITVIRVPETAARQVTALIEQYKLYKLAKSYTPPFDVRDGIMWHVYFAFGKSHTSCSADNAWPPKDLRDGIDAVNAFFGELIDASQETDIIRVIDNR